MSDDVPKFLKPLVADGHAAVVRELLVWGFRTFVVLAFLWMKATFVTQEKYDSDKGKSLDALTSISVSLGHIDEKLTNGAATDINHEKRIWELEHAKR
jgi:hypothetical protein